MLYSKFSFSSVQFSHSVVSDSSLPHGLQHARLPCPSPASGACSNSCPSSWWCQLRFSLVIYFTVVYICQSQSPSLSHPIFSPWYPYGSSLHLCLYFCLANKSICIIFLDSTYKWYYFWLASLCMTVYPCFCKWNYFVPFLANIPLYRCTISSLFTPLFMAI